MVEQKPTEKKILTNTDILASKGLVEVTNPDGSKSQITIEEAKKRVEANKQLEEDLKKLEVTDEN